jgi:hypothetical protein
MNDATSVPRPLLSMYSIQRRFRTIRWVSFSKPRTNRLSSSASSPKTIRPRHRTTAMLSVLETSSFRATDLSRPSCRALSRDDGSAPSISQTHWASHCCCKIGITLIDPAKLLVLGKIRRINGASLCKRLNSSITSIVGGAECARGT